VSSPTPKGTSGNFGEKHTLSPLDIGQKPSGCSILQDGGRSCQTKPITLQELTGQA
jgi:hypothetical protein